MDKLEQDLFSLAVSELPRGFVRSVLRVLPQIYQEAAARSFQEPAWEEPEGHDICGHLRRALFETQFRKLAHESGLFAKPFRNIRRTGSYTLVRSGRLVLTESAIQYEHQMVRPAWFRKQHAAVNAILSAPLLPELGIEPANLCDPGEVYGILFHGPLPRFNSQLGFAVLGFPDVSSHRTLYRFSLAAIARAQVDGVAEPREIEDQAQPKLRTVRKPNQE